MARYNIFQRMEREIDFQFEYEKIEDIILNEINSYQTIEKQIEDNFKKWKPFFFRIKRRIGIYL